MMDELIKETPPNNKGLDNIILLRDCIQNSPKFLVDKDLHQLMTGAEGVKESLGALHEAGIMHVPFPNIVVEIPNFSEELLSVLVLIKEIPESGREYLDEAWELTLLSITNKEVLLAPAYFKICWEPNGWGVSADKALYLPDNLSFDWESLVSEYQYVWPKTVCYALQCMLLLMNTRGVEKIVVEPPERLNKQRVRKHRPSIPKYSLIRIGHVYQSNGTTTKEHRHQRVHWRRGHTRNQRYGPKRTETRLVYIAPILVNYVGGEVPHVPDTKVVW